jgi:hypothetical protein
MGSPSEIRGESQTLADDLQTHEKAQDFTAAISCAFCWRCGLYLPWKNYGGQEVNLFPKDIQLNLASFILRFG